MFICIACPVWKSLIENSIRDSWAFSNRGEAGELYLLNCLECTMVDLGWLTAWCCLFPYSTLYHHHLPIPVCCHVWGFWPWNPDDSDCCLDGGEGKPDSVPEEWQWGNVADHAELCIWKSCSLVYSHPFPLDLTMPITPTLEFLESMYRLGSLKSTHTHRAV